MRKPALNINEIKAWIVFRELEVERKLISKKNGQKEDNWESKYLILL